MNAVLAEPHPAAASADPSETPDLYSAPDAWGLLAALSLSHFFNDFCLGIAAPMIPSMERKYGISLGAVAGILIVTSLVGNFTQPLAGWAMERSRTARALLFIPFLCALTFFIGFTTETWQARVLFFVAGAANGAFHPYSFLLAQMALPRRPALSTAIFISFGFLGVSSGAMVSGNWLEHWGFDGFHWLYLGACLTSGALLLQRTARIPLAPYLAFVRPARGRAEGEPAPRAPRRAVPFALIFAVGFLMAFQGGTIMFFTPTLFKKLYGSEGLGGTACFIYGVIGGASSYLYAHWADRSNPFKATMFGQLGAILPLAGFFLLGSAGGKIAMISLLGATAGATLPVMTSLARGSRGLSVGLRMSLMLGGTWGLTAIVHWGLAHLADGGRDLSSVMATIMVAPFLIVPALWFAWKNYEA